LKEYLCSRFRPPNPPGYWRTQFRNRKQAIKENVIAFAQGLLAIVSKLKMYDPGNPVSDRELMEVFLGGLHPYYRKLLVGAPDVKTFEYAVERARGLEEGYRSVHPDGVHQKFYRIGEPILDATCILTADPKNEAELLGMSTNEVERLLTEAKSKVQRGMRTSGLNDSCNVLQKDMNVDTDKRLDKMERMIERLQNTMEAGGQRIRPSYSNNFVQAGTSNYPRPNSRTFPNRSRGGFGNRGGYVASFSNDRAVASFNDDRNRKRPAETIICFKCGADGHFARNCKEQKPQSVEERRSGEQQFKGRTNPLNSNRA